MDHNISEAEAVKQKCLSRLPVFSTLQQAQQYITSQRDADTICYGIFCSPTGQQYVVSAPAYWEYLTQEKYTMIE